MTSSNVHRNALEPKRTGSLALRLIATALLVAVSFAITGCSGSFDPKLSGGAVNSSATGATFTGRVHGGQAPIYAANVYVFQTGEAGYPGGGVAGNTSIISSSSSGSFNGSVNGHNYGAYVTTDINGNFTFTLNNCTTGAGVYIVSYGGQPIFGTPNAAAAEMAPIGICPANGITGLLANTPFVNVNEVSTVAMAYAMGGFTAAGYDFSHISTSATNITAMQNAFNMAQQLFSVNTTGGANTSSASLAGAIFDAGKINLMANVLADCINSNGSIANTAPCGLLFQNATSNGVAGGGSVPSDTATAMINITHNVMSNVSTIIGLATNSYSPYSPTATTATSDLSLTVTYTSVPSTYDLFQLAIDGSGNVYGSSFYGPSRGTTPLVVKISPTSGYIGSASLAGTSYEAIDQLNNIFFFNTENAYSVSTGSLSKYALSSTGVLGANVPITLNAIATGAYGYYSPGFQSTPMFMGPTNNILLVNYTNSVVYNIPTTGLTSLTATTQLSYPHVAGPLAVAQGENGNYNFWVVNETAEDGTVIDQQNSTFANYSWGNGHVVNTVGLDAFANAWSTDLTNNQLLETNNSSLTSTVYQATVQQLGDPVLLALDGLNNFWVANGGSLCSVELFSASTGSFVYSNALPVKGCGAGSLSSDSVAVDQGGNLWVAVGNATGTSATNGYVAEVLGVAAPTPQPLSLLATKQLPTNITSDLRP